MFHFLLVVFLLWLRIMFTLWIPVVVTLGQEIGQTHEKTICLPFFRWRPSSAPSLSATTVVRPALGTEKQRKRKEKERNGKGKKKEHLNRTSF